MTRLDKGTSTHNFHLSGQELTSFQLDFELMLNALQDHSTHAADLNTSNNLISYAT